MVHISYLKLKKYLYIYISIQAPLSATCVDIFQFIHKTYF